METVHVSPEPALLDTKEAAKLLGISPRHFATLELRGDIGPQAIKLGARCLYAVSELRSWAAAGCPDRAVWAKREA